MNIVKLRERLMAGKRIRKPIARTVLSYRAQPEELLRMPDLRIPAERMTGRIPDSFVPASADPVMVADHLELEDKKREEFIGRLEKVVEMHTEKMRRVIKFHPKPFTVSRVLEIGNARVMLGSKMKLSGYDAIPVYIEKAGDRTRLVFAYKSKSHECWRRFAGSYAGVFHKGPDEYLQNFDWRIQKALDEVSQSVTRTRITKGKKHLLDIDHFCPTDSQTPYILKEAAMALIIGSEILLQEAHEQPYDDKRYSRPTKLLDYWLDGDVQGPYGEYINLIVASGDYIYCVALTEDGIFPKFAQRNVPVPEINAAGAPLHGASIPDEHKWIFTPIVEYNRKKNKEMVSRVPEVDIDATLSLNQNRIRIRKVHEFSQSPLFELGNGLAPLSLLMRTQCFDHAVGRIREIKESGGVLPLSGQRPNGNAEGADSIEVARRLNKLMRAFMQFRRGVLVEHTKAGRSLMLKYAVYERELALFKRYAEYLKAWDDNDEVPDFAMNVVRNRFRKLAEQWACDMHAETAQNLIGLDGTPSD
jgi:hypothetical protein